MSNEIDYIRVEGCLVERICAPLGFCCCYFLVRVSKAAGWDGRNRGYAILLVRGVGLRIGLFYRHLCFGLAPCVYLIPGCLSNLLRVGDVK